MDSLIGVDPYEVLRDNLSDTSADNIVANKKRTVSSIGGSSVREIRQSALST